MVERLASWMGLRKFRSGDWLLVLQGILVAVAIITIAERAREDADRHLRAQAVVESVRASAEQLSAITGSALADAPIVAGPDQPATAVARGFGAWTELHRALGSLETISPGGFTNTLREDARRMYAAGIHTLLLARSRGTGAATGQEQTIFRPLLDRLNTDAARASRHERRAADAASEQGALAFVGSLGVGLVALLLLGARLEGERRRRSVAAERREVEARSEARLRALLEHASDVVTVVGPDLRVQWQGPSVQKLLGRDPASTVGADFAELAHRADARLVAEFLAAAADRAGPQTLTARFPHVGGHVLDLEIIAENRLADPAVEGLVLSMRDVTARKAREDQLRHRAFHDPLTGLPNRALFVDRLSHALNRSRRSEQLFAVLFLDLDNFKAVNDRLGHAHGDRLLGDVSSRLRTILRPSDTAARLGGDEFAILIEGLHDESEARIAARRIVEAMVFAVPTDGELLRVTASVGVAMCNDATVIDDLLRDADAAMYAAKQAGKASVRMFEPSAPRRAGGRAGGTLSRRLGTTLT